jgi:hypothetical protein
MTNPAPVTISIGLQADPDAAVRALRGRHLIIVRLRSQSAGPLGFIATTARQTAFKTVNHGT